MYSAVNLYSDDVVVDVITIRKNQNFYLRLFVKVRVVTQYKALQHEFPDVWQPYKPHHNPRILVVNHPLDFW
jgi:hypothetical protein